VAAFASASTFLHVVPCAVYATVCDALLRHASASKRAVASVA
jgi:hypothetical protein